MHTVNRIIIKRPGVASLVTGWKTPSEDEAGKLKFLRVFAHGENGHTT